MTRPIRIVATTVLLVLLVLPVLLDRDGFPLSTYPMYSRTRPGVVSFVVAYAIDDVGDRHELSMATIGQSDDPLVVAGELRAVIRNGRADDRCAEIARRVHGDGSSRLSSRPAPRLTSVEVVSERHDVVSRMRGEPSVIDREVHARCDVGSAA